MKSLDTEIAKSLTTLLFSGLEYIKCDKCERSIYWGTEEKPSDLLEGLKAHKCFATMSDEEVWELNRENLAKLTV